MRHPDGPLVWPRFICGAVAASSALLFIFIVAYIPTPPSGLMGFVFMVGVASIVAAFVFAVIIGLSPHREKP